MIAEQISTKELDHIQSVRPFKVLSDSDWHTVLSDEDFQLLIFDHEEQEILYISFA